MPPTSTYYWVGVIRVVTNVPVFLPAAPTGVLVGTNIEVDVTRVPPPHYLANQKLAP